MLWPVAIHVLATESPRNLLESQALLLSMPCSPSLLIAVVNLTIMVIQVTSARDSIVIRRYCHRLPLWIDVPIELYPLRVVKIGSPHSTRLFLFRLSLELIVAVRLLKTNHGKANCVEFQSLWGRYFVKNHCALPASPFLSRPSVIDYSTFINFIVRRQIINLRAPTKITFYLCHNFLLHSLRMIYSTSLHVIEGNRCSTIDMK
ncbi:hypothetical protein EUGRSUZ_C01416 [Eucalyptus grandis]|uniref:Uncharacterized protein n=2 Tax=Eucalyptus grandis TaxID=71139 RepID=A0ACC3LCZ8_EUCGR|nr:hypothetical protein EUGRSUZ_C01416 [Eucalyptus grandis]